MRQYPKYLVGLVFLLPITDNKQIIDCEKISDKMFLIKEVCECGLASHFRREFLVKCQLYHDSPNPQKIQDKLMKCMEL